MAVSDRDIDRAMQFGLEDFDWFWVVVELATGRRQDNEAEARDARRSPGSEE